MSFKSNKGGVKGLFVCGKGLNRFLICTFWLSICTTWALIHFIQGSRHVSQKKNKGLALINIVSGFHENIRNGSFGNDSLVGLNLVSRDTMGTEESTLISLHPKSGVFEDIERKVDERGIRVSDRSERDDEFGEKESQSESQIENQSASESQMLSEVGGNNEGVDKWSEESMFDPKSNKFTEKEEGDDDTGNKSLENRTAFKKQFERKGMSFLTEEDIKDRETSKESEESEGKEENEGSEGKEENEESVGSEGKDENEDGGKNEGREEFEEAEEFRQMLSDVKLAVNSYKVNEALERFWNSAEHAGMQDEEGDKEEGEDEENVRGEGKGKGVGGLLNEKEFMEVKDGEDPTAGGKLGMRDTTVSKGESEDSEAITVEKLHKDVKELVELEARKEQKMNERSSIANSGEKSETGVGFLRETSNSEKIAREGEKEREGEEWEKPEEVWTPPKTCGTVEEMGEASVGDVRIASLRVRKLIREYIKEHGGTRVRSLSEKEFCKRNFVVGKGQHDGFGNNMYKILTAAGLGIMLNRTVILGEQGQNEGSSTHPKYVSQKRQLSFPFGEYVSYSQELMSMQEVKRLWVKNGCSSRHNRKFRMRVDSFAKLPTSKILCDDWTKWDYPVIWLADAIDAVALQMFLKNRWKKMRDLATLIMGQPWDPNSRPNIFGELALAFMSPSPVVQKAINWTLGKQGDPDFVLHLRLMSQSPSKAITAANLCIQQIFEKTKKRVKMFEKRSPRIAILADTPSSYPRLEKVLSMFARVVRFDFEGFVKENPNLKTMNFKTFKVPEERSADWGPLPRWVAIVDFFLAARSRFGVFSGAGQRVASTFVQLAAAYGGASRLNSDGSSNGYQFYSSFHAGLLVRGLRKQSGRGHGWHTFGGPLSCHKQERQCSLTSLLPYAWWDAPWQSPLKVQVKSLRSIRFNVTAEGRVTRRTVERFCEGGREAGGESGGEGGGRGEEVWELELPDCKTITVFDACTPPASVEE